MSGRRRPQKEPDVDGIIRDAIVDHLELGIPTDADIADAVMRLALADRGSSLRPVRWAVVGAIAAVLVTSAVVLAVASGNWPVRLALIPAQNPPIPIDKSGAIASSAPAADEGPAKVGPRTTTLAAAQQAFGRHVLTASVDSGAVLNAVYFAAATPLPLDAKPGSPPSRDTVELAYSYAGSHIEITEVVDPTTGPLTVDALDQGGAKLKAAGGLGAATIESVDGSAYVVGRSADGSTVEWILWKSAAGIVVTAHFEPGLGHDAALVFVATFQ
jgi:hypothetical protein